MMIYCLIYVLSCCTFFLLGALLVGEKAGKKLLKYQDTMNNYNALFLLANQWIGLKLEKKTILQYFNDHKYKRIAIYGMGHLARTLIDELQESKEITICYLIDKKNENIITEFPIYSPDGFWEEVDILVVTPIYYYDEIKSELEKKLKCPIISLDTIINDVTNN